MLLLVLCVWLATAAARIVERCELARELIELGVEKEQLGTWVCIAFHESRFDTAARNPHSGDHGLLQISELYWCGKGKACGLLCHQLRDDDIEDDVRCAQLIHEEHTRLQGDGFLAWVVYPHYCKHNTKKYLVDCDLKNTKEKIRAENSTINLNQKIDELSAPYLTINSILRSNDFKLEETARSNWLNFKVDNIDELQLPVLSNPRDKTVVNARRVENIITDDATSRKASKPAYVNTPKREPPSFDHQYDDTADKLDKPFTDSPIGASNRASKKSFHYEYHPNEDAVTTKIELRGTTDTAAEKRNKNMVALKKEIHYQYPPNEDATTPKIETRTTTNAAKEIQTENIVESKQIRSIKKHFQYPTEDVPPESTTVFKVSQPFSDRRNDRQYNDYAHREVNRGFAANSPSLRTRGEIYRPDTTQFRRRQEVTTLTSRKPVRNEGATPNRHYQPPHQHANDQTVPRNYQHQTKDETTTIKSETTTEDPFEIYLNTRNQAFTKYSFLPLTGRHIRLNIFNDGSTTPLPRLRKTPGLSTNLSANR